MKTKPQSYFKRIGYILFTATIISAIFLFYGFSLSQVVGMSMSPTVEHGQWIVTNHYAYQFDQPKRGDIVTIDYKGGTYIKRIIGLPNETIEIRNQQLYIDGMPYSQNFITNTVSFWTNDIKEIDIPDDSYYVLGDNRRISRDSREGLYSLGFIDQGHITGRAELIVYPFSDWQIIH